MVLALKSSRKPHLTATFTVSDWDRLLLSVTVSWNWRISPALLSKTGAVKVGVGEVESESVTAVPGNWVHSYEVIGRDGSDGEDPVPSNVTVCPMKIVWSSPASAFGGGFRSESKGFISPLTGAPAEFCATSWQ